MFSNKYIKMTLMGIFTVSSVIAVPRKYSNCEITKKIISPKESTGHFFGENCKTVYVLPPKYGNVYVNKIAPTTNMKICEAINANYDIISGQMIFQKRKHDEIMSIELDPVKVRKITVQKKKCAKLEKDLNEAETALRSVMIDHNDFKSDMNEAKEEYKECKESNKLDSNCSFEKDEYKRAKSIFKSFRNKKLNPIKRIVAKRKSNSDFCNSSYEKLVNLSRLENEETKNMREQIRSSVNEVTDDILKLNTKFGHIAGSTVNVIFESKFQELIEKYKKLNRDINFHQMPVEMYLSATIKVDSSETYLPGVINSSVPGLPVQINKPDGGVVSPINDEIPQNNNTAHRNISASLGGQLSLNMNATCPAYNNGDFNLKNMFTAHMVANVYYNYQVQTDRKYKVEYKLSTLMEKIKEQTSKKGFFKTKTVNSLTHKNNSKEWIKITFSSQDASNSWVDEDKLREDIKKEFIDRALKKVVKTQVNNLKLIEPGEAGIKSASSNLKKGCYHYYCQVAALGLDVLGNSFGGKSAVSKFIETNDIWQKEEVKHKKMIPHYGSFTFKGEGQ